MAADKQWVLTEAKIRAQYPNSSLRVVEGKLSDGRGYVSELWAEDGMTLVTWYIPAEETGGSKEEMEQFLIREGKLKDGEKHSLGIVQLEVDGHAVWSVTVTVGDEDGLRCQAYL